MAKGLEREPTDSQSGSSLRISPQSFEVTQALSHRKSVKLKDENKLQVLTMPKWLPLDDEVLCDLAEVYPKHSWEDLARKFNRSFKTSAPPRTPSSLYSRHRKLRPGQSLL